MDVINSLVELEIAIKKAYLKLNEYELANNTNDYQEIKDILFRLIDKENMLFKEIIKDNNLMIKFSNYIVENMNLDNDSYDEIFIKDLRDRDNGLILLRMRSKFNNNLIHLTDSQVLVFSDSELLENLKISSKIEEIAMFNWNIGNIINSVSNKLELNFLNEAINGGSYMNEDVESLRYYRNLFVFLNPGLEKYYLSEEELSLSMPSIFNDYNNYSDDHKKVYLNNILRIVKQSMVYLINAMLADVDYSNYMCSKRVINDIYLMGIKSGLHLLNEDDYHEFKNGIYIDLHKNSKFLNSIGKQNEALSLINLLEEHDKLNHKKRT